MLIQLSEIMSVPDKIQHEKAELTMPCFQRNGEAYAFSQKEPIDITVTNLGKRKVLVEAFGKCSLIIPCSRCLEGVNTPFSIKVVKEFDFKESEEKQDEEWNEVNYLEGYDLDVDRMIYDEILLDFPLKVLCKEECKGICNRCGQNLNESECGCQRESLDPRMSAVLDIFKNSSE